MTRRTLAEPGDAPAPGHALRFAHLDRIVTVHAHESIYQSARRNGVRIVGACGGRGTCGSCMVKVVEGRVDRGGHALADDSGAETGSGRERRWLRACQAHARSDCTLEIAPRSLAPVARAEIDTGAGAGAAELLVLDATVTEHVLTFAAPTLADPVADVERIARALAAAGQAAPARVDLACARALPKVLRDQRWHVSLRLRGDELIDVAPVAAPLLGLAVDLGTTNAAGFLIDLRSGNRLASLGIENPQAGWGADLVSRINHAIGSAAALEELRAAAATAIDALAHDLALAVGARPQHIVEAVICGNTAMHHLLLGLPVRQLGRAPFVAAHCAPQEHKARELGLHLAGGAVVHLAGNVGGFVGGDHVAALLATREQWQAVRTALVMDIGTNTEISLIHDGRILSASCPSGPALEGGHIGCGMRAAEGAIERVRLQGGRLAVQTIGHKPAVGLCGSGVLDAVAVLLRAGIVDRRGRIDARHPDVSGSTGARAVQLAPGVAFSQADMRAVQLAKAAIRTGVLMLLAEAGLTESAIERFVIAGAFGAYIDVASAIEIGLLPELPRERFVQVGNAAGLGVRQMLCARGARAQAAEIAARCRYVELSTRADFQKTFMHTIGFAPLAPEFQ